MIKNQLPSDKAAQKIADAKKLEEERKEQESHLRTIMNGAFQSPDGVLVLKWLAAQCGWGKPIQMHDDRTMALGVMRLNLYTEIRKHINPEILRKVENQ